MKRVEIRVQNGARNEEKASLLFTFLRSLDFIELIETNELPPNEQARDEEFFALAGIWEGRDITLGSIRQEAWLRQSS